MHGGDIYRQAVTLDFSVNISPLGVPERVREALRAAVGRVEEYPDPRHERLVRALAEFFDVSGNRILVGNGASELIMAVCHALRPESAMITAPSFSGYREALRAVLPDSRIFRYELRGEVSFLPDEGLVAAVFEKKPDLLILTDPNNPNGLLIPPELLRRILDACGQTGTLLLLDACFMELAVRDGSRSLTTFFGGSDGSAGNRFSKPSCETGGKRGLVLRDFPSRAPWIELRAFTKSFAIPGVRLGYAVCSGLALAESVRRHLPEWNLSVFAEEAGLACLAVGDTLQDARSLILRERTYLSRELSAIDDGSGKRIIGVCPSDANFLLFRYGPDVRAGRPGLYRQLLDRGILIRDCSDYEGLCAGWYRIAVRTHEENEMLVRAIREAAEDIERRDIKSEDR